MNLTNATEVTIDGKIADKIYFDGKLAYERDKALRLVKSCPYVKVGETVDLTATLKDGVGGELISFYLSEDNFMTKELIDTDTTDSTGTASVTYTGSGLGSIRIMAVYDDGTGEITSNKVIVDDYIAIPSSITLASNKYASNYGENVTFTATCLDQYGRACPSGETVTFYDGETSIGTGTTDNNGVATLTRSDLNAGSYSIVAIAGEAESNACSVTVAKLNTSLTIETPALVYSDMFDVNGTLKDSNSSGIVGATVTLHWKIGSRSEQTASVKTTTGGAYNFHSGPVQLMSQYKFWITFDGSQNYNGSSSSEINVDPDKETTVLNVTAPTDYETVTTDSVTFTGTFLDNDGNIVDSGTLAFYANGSYYGNISFSSGTFSYTYPGLREGSNYFQLLYGGNNRYTAVGTDLIHVVRVSYDGIDLLNTGDCILSYADRDTVTLTAQLTDDDVAVAVSGVEVDFYDYTDSSNPVKLNGSSISTDVNGQASYTYTSRGVGDCDIKAKTGSLVTETYEIEDCIDTILGGTDQSSKFGSSIGLRNSGTSSITYDSTNNYYSVDITKNGSESFVPINSANGLNDFIIEFDGYLPLSSGSLTGLCFYKDDSNWGRLGTKWEYTGSRYEYGGNTNGSYSENNITGYTPPTATWLHHKFTITNDTVHRQVYNGDTLVYEDTRTYTGFFTSNTKYGFSALWGTGWKQYFKNIKIKPL